ncbi:MAG: hypothetical protein MZV70_77375 [Desulfobacterales bacterium]|nr:hypothetical protein [Desulfobacterales bacterium]
MKKLLSEGEIPANLKQEYALFLVQLADSSTVKEHFEEALPYIDNAIAYASDPSSLIMRKNDLVGKAAKAQPELAQAEFENGKQNKDPGSPAPRGILCEGRAGVRLDIFGEICTLVMGLYAKRILRLHSGYVRVIENITDTVLFRKANKYDILLAVPTISKGGQVSLIANMHNYRNNPLKLKAEHFFIADNDRAGCGIRLQPEPSLTRKFPDQGNAKENTNLRSRSPRWRSRQV